MFSEVGYEERRSRGVGCQRDEASTMRRKPDMRCTGVDVDRSRKMIRESNRKLQNNF